MSGDYWTKDGLMMSYSQLRETLKRIEFNMTEPEVLVKLIESAIHVGKKVRSNNRSLSSIAARIADDLKDKWILKVEPSPDTVGSRQIVAIDGSSFPIEGLSGDYHVPLSAAAIEFPDGIHSKVQIRIDAEICSFSVSDRSTLSREIALTMLSMETKLMQLVSDSLIIEKHPIVMLDGPIVDPPMPTDKDYVRARCNALKACLNKEAFVLGVVKSPRETFFCDMLSESGFTSGTNIASSFKNDFYLMAQVFNQTRKAARYNGPLRSSSMPLSKEAPGIGQYSKNDVFVYSFFYQDNRVARPLRVDWCTTSIMDAKTAESTCDSLGKIVRETSFPGIPYPLPVFLAHKKCSIKQGCAEVLFEDIMTRARTTSEEDAILVEIVKGRR